MKRMNRRTTRRARTPSRLSQRTKLEIAALALMLSLAIAASAWL